MRTPSPVLGLLVGLVLLAGMVGFAVGLPAVADDQAGAAVPSDPFPDRVAGGDLVAYDQLEQVQGIELTPEELTAELDSQSTYAADRLGEVFETDVAVTTYVAPDLSAQAEVAVSGGEPGLFRLGMPADPDEPHGGPWYDVVADGDVQCFITWASDEQAASGVPSAVQCQRGAEGRTYDIRAAGLTVDRAVAALNEIVAHTEG